MPRYLLEICTRVTHRSLGPLVNRIDLLEICTRVTHRSLGPLLNRIANETNAPLHDGFVWFHLLESLETLDYAWLHYNDRGWFIDMYKGAPKLVTPNQLVKEMAKLWPPVR
jgi:hypothetical protein